MSVPEAFCVETGTILTVLDALQICAQLQGQKLQLLCTNEPCQVPQFGQKHPARISGVKLDCVFTGIKPHRSPHFRLFPKDEHHPDCPIVEYAEVNDVLGDKRRGRLVLTDAGQVPRIIVEKFWLFKNIDDASAGQITEREKQLIDGKSKSVRKDIYTRAFLENPTQTSRLAVLAECFEWVMEAKLGSKDVCIDGKWTTYERIFRSVERATTEPKVQLIKGNANVKKTETGYRIKFFNPPLYRRPDAKIILDISLTELSKYRFRAGMLATLARVTDQRFQYVTVYCIAQPVEDVLTPDDFVITVVDFERLFLTARYVKGKEPQVTAKQ